MVLGAVATRERAKREQILDGARRVFLRAGFAAASTDEIAREAGVSKRTLYAYYPGKEELFGDVLRGLTIENPQTRVLDFVQGVAPRDRAELRAALIELAQKVIATNMNSENLALLRTIIADAHRFPQLGEIVRSTVPERGLRECGAMLRRAQENGVAIAGDTEAMTRLFIGPLLTYVMIDGLLRPEGQSRPPAATTIEELVDLVMAAITPYDAPQRSER